MRLKLLRSPPTLQLLRWAPMDGSRIWKTSCGCSGFLAPQLKAHQNLTHEMRHATEARSLTSRNMSSYQLQSTIASLADMVSIHLLNPAAICHLHIRPRFGVGLSWAKVMWSSIRKRQYVVSIPTRKPMPLNHHPRCCWVRCADKTHLYPLLTLLTFARACR